MTEQNITSGIAYIIETRRHPALPLVIENMHQILPDSWEIWCFCSKSNKDFVSKIAKNMNRVVIDKLLNTPIGTLESYNDLLLSTGFWEQFNQEDLLGFQVDSWVNPDQKEKLNSLLEYDYVGAPWSDRIRRRWSYIPAIGGNGGICFSKKSARLKALNDSDYPKNSGSPHYQELNEDIWFSTAMPKLGMKLPNRELASSFMVESVFSEQPFAVHKPWLYLESSHYEELTKQISDLTQLEKLNREFDQASKRKPLEPSKITGNSTQSYRLFLLEQARESLRHDNYHATDVALRASLARYPNDPTAHNLLAMLAFRVGAFFQANNHVDKALQIRPDFAKALENRKLINRAITRKTQEPEELQETKYLLINSWGSGFGFDLLYLLGQLLLCEMTGRTPIIHWGGNSLYSDQPHRHSVFDRFFEPLNELNLKEAELYKDSIFPSYWKTNPLSKYLRRTKWRNKITGQLHEQTFLSFLDRKEQLLVSGEYTSVFMMKPWLPSGHPGGAASVEEIYRALIKKYLVVNADISEQVQHFIDRHFKGKGFYAVHLRGTDKHNEKQSHNIDEINSQLIQRLESINSEALIFLMTDDQRIVKQMMQRFDGRVVMTAASRADSDEQGVHHRQNNKEQLGIEVLIDMLIGSKAEHFFGCGFSYLSCLVSAMREDKQSLLLPYNVLNRLVNVPEFK